MLDIKSEQVIDSIVGNRLAEQCSGQAMENDMLKALEVAEKGLKEKGHGKRQ